MVASRYSLCKLSNLLFIPNKQQVLLRSFSNSFWNSYSYHYRSPSDYKQTTKDRKTLSESYAEKSVRFRKFFQKLCRKIPVRFRNYSKVIPRDPLYTFCDDPCPVKGRWRHHHKRHNVSTSNLTINNSLTIQRNSNKEINIQQQSAYHWKYW